MRIKYWQWNNHHFCQTVPDWWKYICNNTQRSVGWETKYGNEDEISPQRFKSGEKKFLAIPQKKPAALWGLFLPDWFAAVYQHQHNKISIWMNGWIRSQIYCSLIKLIKTGQNMYYHFTIYCVFWKTHSYGSTGPWGDTTLYIKHPAPPPFTALFSPAIFSKLQVMLSCKGGKKKRRRKKKAKDQGD